MNVGRKTFIKNVNLRKIQLVRITHKFKLKEKERTWKDGSEEMKELIEKVELWAIDKKIDTAESWEPQLKKIVEEVGEFKEELKKADKKKGIEFLECHDEMVEMGDIMVTLIIMAQQRGYDLYDCLAKAYVKIKDRQGETINGSFVKQEDIGKLECSLGG